MTFPSGRLTDGTWLVANDAERDAIGSDDGLQADQRCFNLTNKRHESCVSVDGAAASTWSGIVKFAEVKTHADPSNDPDTQVAWYSIGQQVATTGATTDFVVFTIDDTVDAVYRFTFDVTVFADGDASKTDREVHSVIVQVHSSGTKVISDAIIVVHPVGAPTVTIGGFFLTGTDVVIRIADSASPTTVNMDGDFKAQRMKESITP